MIGYLPLTSTGMACVAIALLNAIPPQVCALDHPSLEQAISEKGVQGALQSLDDEQAKDGGASLLVKIGSIISPSGREQERATYVAERMRAIGLERVTIDATPNVVGVIRGRSGKSLVFVTTLDDLPSVAELQRAAGRPLRIEGDKVVGPGSSDSLATAAMIIAAKAIVDSRLQPLHDLVFAAVAQEETCLVGMKELYRDFKNRAVAFIDVLGAGHTIWDGALTIHWWKVVGSGPAGHSLAGGLPNVNQGIARSVDRIFQISEAGSHDPATAVVNIAMLSSGAEFNRKPSSGWFSLDIRSMKPAKVAAIEDKIRSILSRVSNEVSSRAGRVDLAMEEHCLKDGGERLSDPIALDLVATSTAIARHLLKVPEGSDCPLSTDKLSEMRKTFGAPKDKYREVPYVNDRGSSNMNVAIAEGTPAVGIWSDERGGNWHEPGEWACIPTLIQTAKHILLLAATMGGAK